MDNKHGSVFTRFSRLAAHTAGKPIVFFVAVATIAVWGISGPLFDFSNTWQLVVNSLTTIVTFLMVFLIQNTQNRDTEAMQIKLDELIRSTKGTREEVMNLEELDERELDKVREEYLKLAEVARSELLGRQYRRKE